MCGEYVSEKNKRCFSPKLRDSFEESFNLRLICDACYPHGGEHHREIVGHNTVAAPLREDPEGDGDEESVAVAPGLDHVEVTGICADLLLDRDRVGDLRDFVSD